MAIDIKGITGTPLSPKKITRATDGSRSGGSGAAGGGGDRVSITDTAMSLENVERLMAQIPVVDANRVETVRESLTNGSYEVDAERTAEKFIQFELMLGRQVVEHARA